MKYLKIILICLCSIILLGFLDCTISYIRYRDGKKPLFVLQEKSYHYKDGSAVVYRSFGYQVTEYDRAWMKQRTFSFGFEEPLKESQNDFQIVDETGETCSNAMYYFYEDEDYKYYFTCLRSISIQFRGVKLDLEKALLGSYVTIEELQKKGLEYYREEK